MAEWYLIYPDCHSRSTMTALSSQSRHMLKAHQYSQQIGMPSNTSGNLPSATSSTEVWGHRSIGSMRFQEWEARGSRAPRAHKEPWGSMDIGFQGESITQGTQRTRRTQGNMRFQAVPMEQSGPKGRRGRRAPGGSRGAQDSMGNMGFQAKSMGTQGTQGTRGIPARHGVTWEPRDSKRAHRVPRDTREPGNTGAPRDPGEHEGHVVPMGRGSQRIQGTQLCLQRYARRPALVLPLQDRSKLLAVSARTRLH